MHRIHKLGPNEKFGFWYGFRLMNNDRYQYIRTLP